MSDNALQGRYMEVALKSNFQRLIASLVLGIFVVGCADIITYSQDSRKQGLKLYREQQYADAAGAFRNAIRQNPLDYQSASYLGQSYVQLGQYEQAIHAFRTSLQVQAKDIEGKYNIPFRQNTLNGMASAIAKCDMQDQETNAVESRAQNNGSAEDWFVLAKIFAYRGDPDGAIDAYNRAYLTDPKDFYICKEYGLYLEHSGQREKAEIPLRKAYAVNQQDEEVNNALRRIGVVPGPGLLDQNALAKPIVPRGPIPELDVNKVTGHGATETNGAPSVSAPRD
jgi:tetratricopeptide (TPR) repeat protein